jgi:hypothetical protein
MGGGLGGIGLGWKGTKPCKEGARLWSEVPSEDRICSVDADCALVQGPWCFRLGVVGTAADRYRRQPPCPDPASELPACPQQVAVCREGCCALPVVPPRPPSSK